MCNVTIAKNKLQSMKMRTEKDLYALEFNSKEFEPLTDDTFSKVKLVCADNDLNCPLYKYGGEIKFKGDYPTIYTVLRKLAKEHQIYLDYTKIPE